ncbi:MAG: exopolysaccharide biosynthesis polyprenyl glycosylphosphotransferase [Ignavibacteria bacterium CG1_02_37_35]|nr:MAG: exopolysaccharide biosynthesis polyprenyl glycosylphosphotransferase [Ignavibacteria bacterium CG1_02_37_35]
MSKKTEKILVLLADFLFINLAWIVFFHFRISSGIFDLLVMPEFLFPMLVVYFYWLLIFSFVGMYRTWFALSRFDELSTLFKASFVGIFLLYFLILFDDYTHGVSSESRFLIFFYWGFFFLFVSAGRLAIRGFQRRLLINGVGRRNALLVGFNKKANEIHDEIIKHPALGIDVVGYITIDKDNFQKSYNNISVLGNVAGIPQKIDELHIQEIIIVLMKFSEDLLIEIIGKCENKNVGLKIAPDLYNILSGQARTAQLYGFPLIDINPQLMPVWEAKVKRFLDLIFALIILLLTSPLMLITAAVIKLDSKGPVLFKQERCGQNGKIFNIYKFRSMKQDAEKLTGPVWSTKDDPRITRVGKFVRKVRIDELPQMINILKGEMSLVGPRPERPFFVEKLSLEIPYYKRRLKVRPGITGWAQVKHKYDESVEDVKEKLKYDLFYIENMSLRMDFKIMFRTVFVMLFGKGHFD